MKVPAAILAAAAVTGILAVTASGPGGYIAAAATAASALWLFRDSRIHIYFFGLFTVIFIGLAWLREPVACRDYAERTRRAEVVSASAGDVSQRVVAVLDDGVRVGLTYTDIVPVLCAGDSISFTSELQPLGRYGHVPGMGVEGMSDRSLRLSARAVAHDGDLTVTGHSDGAAYFFDRLRRRLADAVYASPMSPASARLFTTATLATGDVDSGFRNGFSVMGLSHLLCVSGFHVGIVAWLVAWLLMPLRFVPCRVALRRLPAVAVIWLYAMLAGFGPSVVRAAITITVFALARLLERRPHPLNTLAVAFAAVLLIDPYQLFSAGFQLSFTAVAGLVLLAGRFNPVGPEKRLWHRAAAAVAVPAAVMVATAPVLLAWFHRLPLLSVPANAAGMMIFPVFMVSGLAALCLHGLGIPAGWLFGICDRLYELMDAMAGFFASVSEKTSLTLAPDVLTLVCLTGAVAACVWVTRAQGRRLVPLTVVAACLLLASCDRRPEGRAVLIDGTSGGTDICFLSRGHAEVWTARDRDRIVTRAARLFAAYGADTAELRGTFSRDTTVCGLMLADSGIDDGGAQPGVVIIDGRFRGSLRDVVAQGSRQLVVLGADISVRRHDRYVLEADSLGVQVHDLRRKACFRLLQE